MATSGPSRPLRRIGHKGADAIEPGNTLESFEAAVAEGVGMIEFDVLRDREGRLVVAHDPDDAASRRPMELSEALDALREPPLDKVEFDCDLKLPGREAELAGVIEGRDLLERAMVSTMEVSSITKLRVLQPELRVGWTYPKTRFDWIGKPWAAPAVAAGLAAMRRRFPRTLVERVPQLDVQAVWAYDPVITPRLVEAAAEAGVELIAWTVDDADRIADLIAMGVDGICTNDPRLFERAEAIAAERAEAAAAAAAEEEPAATQPPDADEKAKKSGASDDDPDASRKKPDASRKKPDASEPDDADD